MKKPSYYILHRLARDPGERIIFCQSQKDDPFFMQYPQTGPRISNGAFNFMLEQGFIAQNYAPVRQRHSGLDDDAAGYYLDHGELVYSITEAGLEHIGLLQRLMAA